MPLAKCGSRAIITDWHIDTVRRLSKLGVLQSGISARIMTSPATVSRIQAKHGIPHLPRGAKPGDPVPGAKSLSEWRQ